MKIPHASALLFLVLLLAACGPAPTGSDPTPEAPTVAPRATPTVEATPLPTETPELAGRDLPEPDPAPNAVQQAVIDHVALETGIDADKITIISQEEMVWPDGSLGCPQPGVEYLQVLTPGHLIEVDADGETLSVHTNEDASFAIICERPLGVNIRPEPTEDTLPGDPDEEEIVGEDLPILPTLDGEAAEVADRMLDQVVQQSGLTRAELTVTAFEAIVWRDSSLGCPQPGEMYMQVLTPGYRFTVDAAGESMDVHTDRTGDRTIICPEGQSQSPAPPVDE